MLDNIDCLAHMLSYLTVRERETCRQVCQNWLMSADELARTQQSLVIIGQREGGGKGGDHGSHRPYTVNGYRSKPSVGKLGHTVHWPYNFIRFHSYCQMLSRFPNVRSVQFEAIDHWNDHLLKQLTTACPLVRSLAFVRCVGLGRSRLHEKDYMNVTLNGWNNLITHYGHQVTALTLQDCDIDDRQLQLVIAGFRRLKYLDISSNRIGDASALVNLCSSIEVLKVGPRLIGNNVSADIPMEAIVAGSGRAVRELHLQGFLNANLSQVARMNQLERLSIRFMKPLFEDANVINCFAAIGRLQSLRCLEIYQHNTHDCYMALSREHLQSIFNGCNQLEKFVLNCDIWCDSPVDDNLLGHMRRCCPRLAHLDICPGNFSTTDQSLQVLSSFTHLRTLRIVEFSGITEQGLMRFIREAPALVECIVEDCCEVDTANMVDFVRRLYLEHPNRHLNLIITPVRSLHIPTKVLHLPEHNPAYRLTVFGQQNRDKSSVSFFSSRKLLHYGHYSTVCSSASSLVSLLLHSALSLVTFLSTLLAFGAACCFYLLHLVLLNLNVSRFTFNGHVLGIPFLTTGTIVFLSSLFIGPCLYVTSSLVAMFNVHDLGSLMDCFSRLYGGSGHP